MLLTRYAPLRRSPSVSIATHNAAPRLACVKPAASVHPEPGSNSSLYIFLIKFLARPVTLSYSFIKGIYALDILKISHTYYLCMLLVFQSYQ